MGGQLEKSWGGGGGGTQRKKEGEIRKRGQQRKISLKFRKKILAQVEG
jgi:hypothetical protein